jgi:N utilization substance protein A
VPISPFMAAINQIADEKGIPIETVLETIEAALAAAYRKDYGKPNWNIRVDLNADTGEMKVFRYWDIVKKTELEDPEAQLTATDAKKKRKGVKVGETVEEELPTETEFGRIAAQTAKQVIIQRLKEAERSLLLTEFREREHQLINGVIQQVEGPNVIVDIVRTTGILPPPEQVPAERYYPNQRMKFYVKSVEDSSRGPRILLSRSDPQLIAKLFELEVPEIVAKTVEVVGLAREAGFRTKMAVKSNQEGLDPVGSCVGQRGTRVQAVLAEIGEEKIDIILHDEDQAQYIKNALSPAKVRDVKLKKKEKRAIVDVADDQLSLAIGRGGQNVRLASKLTGWEIDILKKELPKTEQPKTEESAPAPEPVPEAPALAEKPAEPVADAPAIIEEPKGEQPKNAQQ